MSSVEEKVAFIAGKQDEMSNRVDQFHALLKQHMDKEDEERNKIEGRLKSVDKKIWVIFFMVAITLATQSDKVDWAAVISLLSIL